MVNKPTVLKTIVIDINNNETLSEVKVKLRTQINHALAEIKTNLLELDEGWTKNVLSSDCADWLTKINLHGDSDAIVCDFANINDPLERKKAIIFYGNRVLAEIWIVWNKIWASKIEPGKNNDWESGKKAENNLQFILNWVNHEENTATKKTIKTTAKNSAKTYETIVKECIKQLLTKFCEYAKTNQPGGGFWNLKTGDYADYETIFDNTNDLNSLEKIKKVWEVLEKVITAKKISENVPEINNILEVLNNCQKSEKDVYKAINNNDKIGKIIDEAIVHLKGIKKEGFVAEIDELLQKISENDKTDVSQIKAFIEGLKKWTEQTRSGQEIDQTKKKEVNDALINLTTILNQLEGKVSDKNDEEKKPILVVLSFVVLVLTLVGLALWSIRRWNNKGFED